MVRRRIRFISIIFKELGRKEWRREGGKVEKHCDKVFCQLVVGFKIQHP
jgi:hypothetical protein